MKLDKVIFGTFCSVTLVTIVAQHEEELQGSGRLHVETHLDVIHQEIVILRETVILQEFVILREEELHEKVLQDAANGQDGVEDLVAILSSIVVGKTATCGICESANTNKFSKKQDGKGTLVSFPILRYGQTSTFFQV
jgi:hypothetical protein